MLGPMIFSAVVTDLDGTIVRADGICSPATLRVLAELRELDVPLVAATARSPAALADLDVLLPYLSLAVCSGGAIGLRPGTGERIWRSDLSGAAVRDLAGLALRRWPWAGLATYDGRRWRMTEVYRATRHTPHSGPVEVCEVEDVLAADACAMAVCHPERDARELIAGLSGRPGVDVHRAGDQIAEVTAAGTDKGSGVRLAVQVLGVDPRRAVAFGDMPIDVPMFAAVGRSVAMADSPPEVLAAATDVTGTFEEDGFADYLGSVRAR